MTEELKDILKYYDEIFIEDSLDKRIEDYCNKKHLYRLYGNKPVVMKEIKISLKEFAKQETGLLSKHLTEAKDLIRNLLRITYGEGWNYSLDWKVKAEQFLKDFEK